MLTRRAVWLPVAVLGLSACRPRSRTTSVAIDGPSAVGGPFQLVDADGHPVTEAVLKGKWTAVYFGYTYCPDVCPTTLQALKEGLEKLGARGKDVQSILISVDPDHDTPAVMKAYVDNPGFPAGLKGFTGSADQIKAAAKAYKVFYEKGPDGLVQHQSIIFLMDPQGRLARPLTGEQSPSEIAAQIGDAMRQAS